MQGKEREQGIQRGREEYKMLFKCLNVKVLIRDASLLRCDEP
jgi:hypothetical protein